ncbi:hypothetical protein ACOMHN_056014 [Nucella lapillus]
MQRDREVHTHGGTKRPVARSFPGESAMKMTSGPVIPWGISDDNDQQGPVSDDKAQSVMTMTNKAQSFPGESVMTMTNKGP